MESRQLASLLSNDWATSDFFRGIYNDYTVIINPIIDLNEPNVFVYLRDGHYVALIINAAGLSYYVDPLGAEPPAPLMPTIQRWASPWQAMPSTAVQSPRSSLCGLFIYYYSTLICERLTATTSPNNRPEDSRRRARQRPILDPTRRDARSNELLLQRWYDERVGGGGGRRRGNDRRRRRGDDDR